MDHPRHPTEIATERASRYAPPPRFEPLAAGAVGAFVVYGTISAFTALAGLDRSAFWVAALIVSAIGFIGPFFYFKAQERRHYEAWSSEL
jgi:hypothetical protein